MYASNCENICWMDGVFCDISFMNNVTATTHMAWLNAIAMAEVLDDVKFFDLPKNKMFPVS